MTKYQVEIELERGCYECPLCVWRNNTLKRCVLLDKRVEWGFKTETNKNHPKIIVTFDPHEERLKECPLKKIKKTNK
jgi:hypothetical protein